MPVFAIFVESESQVHELPPRCLIDHLEQSILNPDVKIASLRSKDVPYAFAFLDGKRLDRGRQGG